MKKSVKVMAAAMAAMMTLAGCGSKTAETTAADTTAAEITAEAAAEETTAEAAEGVKIADGEYTIGIGQFAEHGSLDNCRTGFLQGLADEGIVEGKNLTILYENAQSAYSAAKDAGVPVIYTAVTDPVLAELANADGTPVGEITGTSDKLPVESQLKMIRTMLPDAKTIGIMYSTSEINSVSAIEEYKKAAPEYGFEIVESGISSTADIPLAADALVEKVDCINNLTDNTVVSSLPVILDKAAKKNIPVFGSEIEQVKIGCLAAVGLDYVSLGEQTGKMAAKVLKGEKKASEMNFEVIEEAAFYGNNKVAENLGITIPAELSDNAAALFDEIITN